MTPEIEKIRQLLDEAHRLAMLEIEKEVRSILGKHKGGAYSFCMAMGSASFYGIDRLPIVDWPNRKKEWSDFYKILDELNGDLQLTGTPMKLESAYGAVITDW